MAHSKAHLFVDPNEASHVVAGYAKAFSHIVRVNIALRLAGRGPLYHYEVRALFGLCNATISHHLAVLKWHGVILAEEHGTYIQYSFNSANLPIMRAYFVDFLGALTENARVGQSGKS